MSISANEQRRLSALMRVEVTRLDRSGAKAAADLLDRAIAACAGLEASHRRPRQRSRVSVDVVAHVFVARWLHFTEQPTTLAQCANQRPDLALVCLARAVMPADYTSVFSAADLKSLAAWDYLTDVCS